MTRVEDPDPVSVARPGIRRYKTEMTRSGY
jgi:hypothetical protein